MSDKHQAPSHLSNELVAFLQGPQLVLVTTLDAETKWPTNNLITWVYAKDAETLRLAADAKGRVMGNIRADERVLLTVMAHGACHTVEGTARVISEEVQGVSLKLAVAEVKVRAVRDVTFWGGRITANPAYDVTYDKALKEKLDAGVFAALKSL
jgi:predicted pyridoxine 5'-phosphate oxidase superfamily flavin-nucleotide-binding protein